MIKVLSVLGTRPEAIKLAPVILELERHSEQIASRVCATAQHRQLLDQTLALFRIKPDYDLDVMRDSQSPTQVAAAVLYGLEAILRAEQPDWVLVQGDTTTVMAASLAACYAKTRIGHIEAGLRTFDRRNPFPEEINRRLVGAVADLHFAPTARAKENLLREGVPNSTIFVTGNPVIDALKMMTEAPYEPDTGPLRDVPWSKRLILVTAHRRENFGLPLVQICLALQDIASAYGGDIHIVCPVHPNPNVREVVYRMLGDVAGIILTEPLDYLSLIYLMKRTVLVLTDSGGLQEEAPSLGKPVLLLRNVTERPEAVEAGTVRIIGTDRSAILKWARLLLDDSREYSRMARSVNPYGDGHAAERIVKALLAGGSLDESRRCDGTGSDGETS